MRPEERHAIKDIRECENVTFVTISFSIEDLFVSQIVAIKEIKLHLLQKSLYLSHNYL